MMKKTIQLVGPIIVVLFVGCSKSEPAVAPPADADAGMDAGAIALADAGADGGVDAGADAGLDAGLGDTTRPTSQITSAVNATYAYSATVSLSGTASDDGGAGVASVEVSGDGGGSWFLATGTTSWSASFAASLFMHSVVSRATDDAGNTEIPDASASFYTLGIPATNVVGNAPGSFTAACESAGGGVGLFGPEAIAFDEVGHRLFVADGRNHRVVIHQLNVDNSFGDYTADMVLGQPDLWSCMEPTSPTASNMKYPHDVLYDSANDRLYVADGTQNRVLVFTNINASGKSADTVLGQPDFTTASTGTTQAKMDGPWGFALGSGNRLFVSDYWNRRVLVFGVASLSSGMNAAAVLGQTDFVTNSAGAGETKFGGPKGLAVDFGGNRLFVSDSYNNRVLMFNIATVVDGMDAGAVLGQGDFNSTGGGLSATQMSNPRGVSYEVSTMRLFVADSDNDRVLVFDVSGGVTNGMAAANVLGQSSLTANGSTVSQSELRSPERLSAPVGSRLFVPDYDNNRVMMFDVASVSNGENAVGLLGQFVDAGTPTYTEACRNGAQATGIGDAYAVAVDTANRRLFVTDSSRNRVLVFNLDSSFQPQDRAADYVLGQSSFGACKSQSGAAGMNNPRGLAHDSVGNLLYVADYGNNRVLVFDLAGLATGMSASRVLGQTSFAGTSSGTSRTTMSMPWGLAVDTAGRRLFVVDRGNNRILVFTAMDLAGIADGMGAANVLGQSSWNSNSAGFGASQLVSPTGVAYQPQGNRLFVGEIAARVVVYGLTGMTETGTAASNVLGQTDFGLNVEGTSASQLRGSSNGRGVVVDPTRNRLFVPDMGNNRVLLFDIASTQNGESAVAVIGQSNFYSSGAGLTSQLVRSPAATALDSSGRWLFVADTANYRVLQFDVAPY
jgi:DNA-binding beta-propeller fold protein YncE